MKRLSTTVQSEEAIEARINALTTENQQLKASIAEANKRVKSAEKATTKATKQVAQEKQKLQAESTKRILETQQLIEDLGRRAKEMEEGAGSEQRVQVLEAQLATTKKASNLAIRQKTQLQKENEELRQQLAEAGGLTATEFSGMKRMLEDRDAQLADVKAQLAQAEAKLAARREPPAAATLSLLEQVEQVSAEGLPTLRQRLDNREAQLKREISELEAKKREQEQAQQAQQPRKKSPRKKAPGLGRIAALQRQLAKQTSGKKAPVALQKQLARQAFKIPIGPRAAFAKPKTKTPGIEGTPLAHLTKARARSPGRRRPTATRMQQ